MSLSKDLFAVDEESTGSFWSATCHDGFAVVNLREFVRFFCQKMAYSQGSEVSNPDVLQTLELSVVLQIWVPRFASKQKY